MTGEELLAALPDPEKLDDVGDFQEAYQKILTWVQARKKDNFDPRVIDSSTTPPKTQTQQEKLTAGLSALVTSTEAHLKKLEKVIPLQADLGVKSKLSVEMQGQTDFKNKTIKSYQDALPGQFTMLRNAITGIENDAQEINAIKGNTFWSDPKPAVKKARELYTMARYALENPQQPTNGIIQTLKNIDVINNFVETTGDPAELSDSKTRGYTVITGLAGLKAVAEQNRIAATGMDNAGKKVKPDDNTLARIGKDVTAIGKTVGAIPAPLPNASDAEKTAHQKRVQQARDIENRAKELQRQADEEATNVVIQVASIVAELPEDKLEESETAALVRLKEQQEAMAKIEAVRVQVEKMVTDLQEAVKNKKLVEKTAVSRFQAPPAPAAVAPHIRPASDTKPPPPTSSDSAAPPATPANPDIAKLAVVQREAAKLLTDATKQYSTADQNYAAINKQLQDLQDLRDDRLASGQTPNPLLNGIIDETRNMLKRAGTGMETLTTNNAQIQKNHSQIVLTTDPSGLANAQSLLDGIKFLASDPNNQASNQRAVEATQEAHRRTMLLIKNTPVVSDGLANLRDIRTREEVYDAVKKGTGGEHGLGAALLGDPRSNKEGIISRVGTSLVGGLKGVNYWWNTNVKSAFYNMGEDGNAWWQGANALLALVGGLWASNIIGSVTGIQSPWLRWGIALSAVAYMMNRTGETDGVEFNERRQRENNYLYGSQPPSAAVQTPTTSAGSPGHIVQWDAGSGQMYTANGLPLPGQPDTLRTIAENGAYDLGDGAPGRGVGMGGRHRLVGLPSGTTITHNDDGNQGPPVWQRPPSMQGPMVPAFGFGNV